MKLLITIFCCTLSMCTGLRTGRIIGGSQVRAGQFPFVVAINVQTSNGRHFCTGALLNDKLVITSGNCVHNAVLFTLRLGATTLDDPNAEILSTSSYVVHPDFNPDTITADIGIIMLRLPIKFTDYIDPIYTYGLVVNASVSAYIIGWGQTGDFVSDLSNHLMYANVTVLSDETCSRYYGSQVTENMACVDGNYNEGTCTGDNGGPLFINDVLPWILGVSSFLSGNGCESLDPSGYTRTYPYLDWIRSNLFPS